MSETKDLKRAMRISKGEQEPKPRGRPKSVVNRITEYGALFNSMNDERVKNGLPPLKTAMQVLIEAIQTDELDVTARTRIADKLTAYESSRAPVISIEHVQNMKIEEEVDAEEAIGDFLECLRKV